MADIADKLAGTIKAAYDDSQPLCIEGNRTKPFLVKDIQATRISTLEHNGIVDYEPTELVITARAGTTLNEINQALAEHRQMLAFDPPQFDGKATLGGTIATGLSGPGRPWAGAARDFVLGTQIINGRGEQLKFGGQVMKNVAGYDASRLMTGAHGVLGLILDVSLKILPRPESEQTLGFEMDADEAIHKMNQWSAQPLPLSGACWHDRQLRIRLSGSAAGVRDACQKLGGETKDSNDLWQDIRDFNHPFFKQQAPVWRLALAPATPMMLLSGEWLIDWGGAQRWLVTDEPGDRIMQETIRHGGHCGQWFSSDKTNLRMPLDESVLTIHKRLKAAFDPGHILNPGGLYDGV